MDRGPWAAEAAALQGQLKNVIMAARKADWARDAGHYRFVISHLNRPVIKSQQQIPSEQFPVEEAAAAEAAAAGVSGFHMAKRAVAVLLARMAAAGVEAAAASFSACEGRAATDRWCMINFSPVRKVPSH